MLPCVDATSAIEASLISPSASALTWSRMPGRLHADRPMDIEVAAVGLEPGPAATSVARWLSAHALLTIAVEEAGQRRGSFTCPLSVHSCAGGWLARALIRPSAWANAASVTIVSLTLAGLAISCDCIPAILRVGYNHAPAAAGAVFRAAKAGDMAALQAALDAGESTAEKDEVRRDTCSDGKGHQLCKNHDEPQCPLTEQHHSPRHGRCERLHRHRPCAPGCRCRPICF